MKTTVEDTWIPLVCPVDGGFVLSPELKQAIGPLWSRSWKTQALVAHLISHFDDALEHLLDYYPCSDVLQFDVDPEWCELLSRKYRDKFMDLPPDWYRSLYRAKLVSLRVPVTLVEHAKLAYYQKYHDYRILIQGFARFMEDHGCMVPQDLGARTATLSTLPEREAWLGFEQVIDELLASDAITTADIGEFLAGSLGRADLSRRHK